MLTSQKQIGAEDMKKKIARAKVPEYEDVTLEGLKIDWLRTSASANRRGTDENKRIARAAKLAYIEALQKAGLMKK